MSRDSLPPPGYVVQIRCLLPSDPSEPRTMIVTPENKNPVMTTTTKTTPSNSFGFASPSQLSTATQTTCNVCKRLLYTFEEILRCRICYGWYHWRCVKPDTVSHYGEHENYFCAKCTDGTTNKANAFHRNTNSGFKDGAIDFIETDYLESAGASAKQNSNDRHIVSATRYCDDKQQPSSTQTYEASCLLPQTQVTEYYYRNGLYTEDGSRSTRQFPQQQLRHGIEGDDDYETSATIQANYEYTPLKEYAAMRTTRISNDHLTNGYQNSPAPTSERPKTSRYGVVNYSDHGYDPTVSRIFESPLSTSTQFASPTVDNLSVHNRQQHFSSTTNLNIGDRSTRHHHQQQQQQQQQQSSRVHSTPYLSQLRDNDVPSFKTTVKHQQHHADSYPAGDNDSGIGINSNSGQNQPVDENLLVEKKLTELVQQLGKQLESDAQKVNDKLESKLKNFEEMIHQQTYIIRQQDEVIERLKGKILDIETERDHFRERLSVHEQDGTKAVTQNQPNGLDNQSNSSPKNHQHTRKYPDTSTSNTENSKPSTKKIPAPRVDQQWSAIQSDHEPTTASRFTKSTPIDRPRLESDSSSAPSATVKLVSSVPLKETLSVSTNNNDYQPMVAKLVTKNPTNRDRRVSDSSSTFSESSQLMESVPLVGLPDPSRRLDNIIHQTKSKDITSPSASYNLAQARQQDRPQMSEPISMHPQQLVTTVHQADSADQNQGKDRFQNRRSSSSSSLASSKSSSEMQSQPIRPFNVVSTDNAALISRNSNTHRSLESLQPTHHNPQGLKPTDKATSLDFGVKPVRYNDPGMNYTTPVEASQPAILTNSPVKGWLRKQNRESFWKRIVPYYCVLTNNALLMHRHDHDRTPQKAISLKGAKILYYDDAKHGPSLELTWSTEYNVAKHYYLYAPNRQEADQWLTNIQTIIQNLGNKPKWQQYRMQT